MASINTFLNEDMTLEAHIGVHVLQIDVPVSMGGRKRAPLPSQLWVASMAGCVGAVAADYCRRYDKDPSGLSVRADFVKADHSKRLQNLPIAVHLPNASCDELCFANVLEKVAERCPVHPSTASFDDVEFTVDAGSS